jgi:hypothetical protein
MSTLESHSFSFSSLNVIANRSACNTFNASTKHTKAGTLLGEKRLQLSGEGQDITLLFNLS